MTKAWPKGGTNTERWRKAVEQVADWVPVDAALAWIDTESGGKLDALSSIGERGLFQVHPDEASYLGMTDDEFQRLTTDQALALRYGIKQMKMYAYAAKNALKAAGIEWHGRDFWKLVKLFHGAFAMPGAVVPAFVRAYGRPPENWAELSQFASDEAAQGHDLVLENASLSKTLRTLTPAIIANAQKMGEASGLPEYTKDKVATIGNLLRSVGLLAT